VKFLNSSPAKGVANRSERRVTWDRLNATTSDVIQASLGLGQPQIIVRSEHIGIKALHQEVR
jgi:hypothetical protein